MTTLTAHRLPAFFVFLVIAAFAALIGLVATAAIPATSLLIGWVVLGGLTAYCIYAFMGDLLGAILLWFVTLIVLHEEFWRMPVPFFFSITIPRIGIVVLVVLLLGMLAAGRIRIRHAWPASGAMLAVAVYFFLSALVTGFETRSIVSVHYRLIGGYLFPFVVFGLVLHSFNTERDFKRIVLFFAALSFYLTFIGWCEHFEIRALIFPTFINDPNVGIHWGRVRGPFVMSPAMGLAMTYCYFNNLVLARNIARGRWTLYVVNAFMVPAIFWTQTRSVWLSFVVCQLIWSWYSRRRTSRVVSVSLLLILGLVVAIVNMENFVNSDRTKGGLTDIEPILLRIGLAQMTGEIVKEHPLFGVGFGHFRDYAPGFAKDPSSPGYAFGTTALEHNNLLSIAAETGIIGVAFYIAMILCILGFSIRLFKKLPPKGPGLISRDMLVLYWILAAAYLIDGTFRETSDNPFANCLFFGLSAIPVALDVLLSPSPIRRWLSGPGRDGFTPTFGGGGRSPTRSSFPPNQPGLAGPRALARSRPAPRTYPAGGTT